MQKNVFEAQKEMTNKEETLAQGFIDVVIDVARISTRGHHALAPSTSPLRQPCARGLVCWPVRAKPQALLKKLEPMLSACPPKTTNVSKAWMTMARSRYQGATGRLSPGSIQISPYMMIWNGTVGLSGGIYLGRSECLWPATAGIPCRRLLPLGRMGLTAHTLEVERHDGFAFVLRLPRQKHV